MKSRFFLLVVLFLSTLLPAQSVHMGDILCTDNTFVTPEAYPSSGKTALGVVFYVDASDTHGWAVSLSDQSSSIQWCSSMFYGYDILDLPNYSTGRTALHDLDGYRNTGIIRNTGDAYDFPAAWAVDYDNGWYLPSAGQMRHLLSCSAEIRSSIQIAGGQPLNYWEPNYYWSSTEIGGYHAFDLSMSGSLGDYVKDNHINYPIYGISVRAIRDFQIPQPVHPEYHVGDLITNADGSQGIVFYVTPDQTNGCMVALHDVSHGAKWGDDSKVPGLPNLTPDSFCGSLLEETDGYNNTVTIQEYQNNPNTAAGLVNVEGGWYLPTAGQLSKLFGALSFIEDKLNSYGSTLSESYYWSSSEADEFQAYCVSFRPEVNVRAGHIKLLEKESSLAVRAIRDIKAAHYTVYGPPEEVFACDSYIWNDSTYFESGTYTKVFHFEDYDSIASLKLTITTGVFVGEIQGESDIYYQSFGDFTYHVDSVPGCFGYEWSIDNQWPITSDPSSPECRVSVNTKGSAVLTLRVYQDCGVTVRSLVIHHDREPGFTIFPNPTDGDVTITLNGMKGVVTILVYDMFGQFVSKQRVDTEMDGINISASLRGKAAGVYFFTLINNFDVISQKVVKKTATSYGIQEWWW